MGLRSWQRDHPSSPTQCSTSSPSESCSTSRSEHGQHAARRSKSLRLSGSKVVLQTKTVLSKQAKKLADEHEQLIMKVTYSLGVLAFGVFCYMLGARPHDIPLLYAAFFIVAAPLRWVYYRAKKWHYFLLDFCYYANMICTFYLLFFSKNEKLFMLCFAFSEGPLAWALIVWRCSLVFSSLDKIVSVLIHLLPGTVAFIIRWWDPITFTHHPVEDGTFGPWPAWPQVESSATLWTWMFAVPLGVYVLWQLLYFAVVHGLRGQRILEDPEVLTSFRELARKASRANNFWWRLSGALGDDKRFLMYALIQAVFTVLTMGLTVPMFCSYRLHAAFQFFKIMTSIWNGGNFFFDVMPRQMHAKAAAKKQLKEQQGDDGRHEVQKLSGSGVSAKDLSENESLILRQATEVAESSPQDQKLAHRLSTGPLTRAATLGEARRAPAKQSMAVLSLALEGSLPGEEDARPCRTCGRCGSLRKHSFTPSASEEADNFWPASSDPLLMEPMSTWEESRKPDDADSWVLRRRGHRQEDGAPMGLDSERSLWQKPGGSVVCMG